MARGLRTIQSFALYYGMGGEDVLSHFDLALVDPGGRNRVGVRQLKERGAIALAYVSVLEVGRKTGYSPPANVLRWQGDPVANEEFNNWILDPRLAATQQRFDSLVHEALSLQYDGVFLDTIGDVEDRQFAPAFMGELVPAAAWLVAETARQYPQCLLVQNWGLHRLLPLTAPLLDGVCWEDFPYDEIGAVPTVHSGIRRMNSFQNQVGLQVLALNQGINSPAVARTAQDAAERCGFLWYGTSDYLQLPQYRPR